MWREHQRMDLGSRCKWPRTVGWGRSPGAQGASITLVRRFKKTRTRPTAAPVASLNWTCKRDEQIANGWKCCTAFPLFATAAESQSEACMKRAFAAVASEIKGGKIDKRADNISPVSDDFNIGVRAATQARKRASRLSSLRPRTSFDEAKAWRWTSDGVWRRESTNDEARLARPGLAQAGLARHLDQ